MTTEQPHAYRVEVLNNPDTYAERWRPALDSDDFDDIDAAHEERRLLIEDGYAPHQVRVAAIVVAAR